MDGRFLSLTLTHPRISHDFYRYANGITRFGLTTETYSKVKIPLPTVPEQKAIAALLTTWDEAIEKTERLIQAKQKQLRVLIQRYISKPQLDEKSEGWEPVKLVDSEFAAYWFKSPRMIYLFWAYSYGITGDRLRLYPSDFSLIKCSIPPISTQKRIVQVLDNVQREIDLLKQLAEKYKTQKRGLMQKMLTGEWRVKPEIVNQYMEA